VVSVVVNNIGSDRSVVVSLLVTFDNVKSRFRGPGSILPDFLRSSGSGKGSTQLREYN
jgi:hypothetical protein